MGRITELCDPASQVRKMLVAIVIVRAHRGAPLVGGECVQQPAALLQGMAVLHPDRFVGIVEFEVGPVGLDCGLPIVAVAGQIALGAPNARTASLM